MDQVPKKLSKLNVKKSTGPDQISARLLRMVAPAIAPILTSLFNGSLLTGQLPSEWKEANITPMSKAGEKHDVNNYQPVSVTPVIAKCFESLIHDQLYTYYTETKKLLDPVQSGFRHFLTTNGRSFTNTTKRRGPRIDPCGTPFVAWFQSEETYTIYYHSLFPLLQVVMPIRHHVHNKHMVCLGGEQSSSRQQILQGHLGCSGEVQ